MTKLYIPTVETNDDENIENNEQNQQNERRADGFSWLLLAVLYNTRMNRLL
jgi:hypothetical protein